MKSNLEKMILPTEIHSQPQVFLAFLFHFPQAPLLFTSNCLLTVGPDSAVGIATRQGLDVPGIEFRCGA
jgi:hypothetical protein